jgi:peroxiredoxin Q/BCP
MLSVGDTAPDFDVAAQDGSRVKLSDLAGKYVLLWFYPKADTPG